MRKLVRCKTRLTGNISRIKTRIKGHLNFIGVKFESWSGSSLKNHVCWHWSVGSGEHWFIKSPGSRRKKQLHYILSRSCGSRFCKTWNASRLWNPAAQRSQSVPGVFDPRQEIVLCNSDGAASAARMCSVRKRVGFKAKTMQIKKRIDCGAVGRAI